MKPLINYLLLWIAIPYFGYSQDFSEVNTLIKSKNYPGALAQTETIDYNSELEHANILRMQGWLYTKTEQTEHAVTAYEEAYQFFYVNDEIQEAIDVLNRAAILYIKHNAHRQAVNHLKLAVSLDPASDNVRANILYNLGMAYSSLSVLDSALVNYETARLIYHDLKNNQSEKFQRQLSDEIDCYLEIANIWYEVENYEKARDQLMAIKISLLPESNNLEQKARVLNDLGNAYFALSNLDDAKTNLYQAYDIKLKLDNPRLLQTSLHILGKIHLGKDSGEYYLKAALSASDNAYDQIEHVDIYRDLLRHYQLSGSPDSTLKYSLAMNDYTSALVDQNRNMEMINARNKILMARTRLDRERKQRLWDEMMIQFIWMGIGLIILCVVLALLLKRYRRIAANEREKSTFLSEENSRIQKSIRYLQQMLNKA